MMHATNSSPSNESQDIGQIIIQRASNGWLIQVEGNNGRAVSLVERVSGRDNIGCLLELIEGLLERPEQ